MTKRITAGLSALLVSLLMILASAAPASASTVYGCQDAWVCFYADNNYAGGRYAFHVQTLYGGTCYTFPASGQPGWPGGVVSNEISSMIFNRAAVAGAPPHYIRFYDDNYCQGLGYGEGSVLLSSGTNYIPSMTAAFGSVWNDRVGSVSYF